MHFIWTAVNVWNKVLKEKQSLVSDDYIAKRAIHLPCQDSNIFSKW